MESKLTETYDVVSLSCNSCGVTMSFDVHTLKKTLDKIEMIRGRCLFCRNLIVISRTRLQEIEERI